MPDLFPYLMALFPIIGIGVLLLIGLSKLFTGLSGGDVSTVTVAGVLVAAGVTPTLFLDPSPTDITIVTVLLLIVIISFLTRFLGPLGFIALLLASIFVADTMGVPMPVEVTTAVASTKDYVANFTLDSFILDLPGFTRVLVGWARSILDGAIAYLSPLFSQMLENEGVILPLQPAG